MPNYVHHHLTITGPEADRERFLTECFSQDDDNKTNFDFDELISEPEHIKADDSPPIIRVIRGTRHELPAWLDWRCENWGTKWNACDTDVRREGETIWLSFDTAWAPPTPIFSEVARRFPTLRIEGSFIDEMHDFGGNILCQNGNVEFEDRSEEIQRSFIEAMRGLPEATYDAKADHSDVPF
jgi:hypothetical protein